MSTASTALNAARNGTGQLWARVPASILVHFEIQSAGNGEATTGGGSPSQRQVWEVSHQCLRRRWREGRVAAASPLKAGGPGMAHL